jgi:YidC/Oxa1 family membrane protein insertase
VPPAAAASTPAAVPAGGAVANASGQPPVSEGAAVAHERITVSTDVLKLTFDTEGGSVIESELLKYPDDTQADRHVLLFDSQSNEVYQAQTGLIGGAFPTTRRRWPSAATRRWPTARSSWWCASSRRRWAASSWSRPTPSSAAPT